VALASLQTQFPARLQYDVLLAPFTTLQIGGPARYFLEVQSPDEMVQAFRAAQADRIPVYLLAGCSNVLIADQGIDGLVLLNKARSITWHPDFTLTVDGGYVLDHLVTDLADRGWADMSFAAGIPGSVGGALIGGAGAFGRLVHEYLIEARILSPQGEDAWHPAQSLGIDYRSSAARDRGDILLAATLGPFQPGDTAALHQEIQRIKGEREEKHPGRNRPSAGSFFKNLPPAQPGGRRMAAGKLLEEAGAKALRVGDAGVFEKHANIIVNNGHATAQDIDTLANQMAALVKDKFGVTLEREVRFLR
jgi:UDP-N-acetylmuramate dehydrogenase